MFEGFIGVDFWTALFVLLNTLAIFFVARKFLFKPVHRLITNRQNEIDDLYGKANEAKKEAEGMRADLDHQLSEAKNEADRIIKEAVSRGEDREREIISKAQSEAAAILDKAADDAKREKRQALNEAKDEIASIAVSLAEKVMEKEVDKNVHASLVDDFIKRLDS